VDTVVHRICERVGQDVTEIPAPLSFTPPPEYYSDSVRMAMSPYGLALEFGVQASVGDARTQAVVRMSPQHAFVFCQILRKNLRAYQEQVGPISLPEEIFAELQIDKEL
jgi:hypothetical protein